MTANRSLVEFLVREGQQVFVMSWRNPDARHAHWDFETYVQAVLDALDAVERVTRADRTALAGVCSGGILATIAAAYLAATGRQDRLAAFALAVTVIDNSRAGVAMAVGNRTAGPCGEGRVPTPRLPGRPVTRARCSRGCAPVI